MKVRGLDGRSYQWKLGGRMPLLSDTKARSGPHLRCRRLLGQLFPLEQRLEEVPLPGSGRLRLDFYLPSLELALEVHGAQHYAPSSHFHETPLDFIQAQVRDRSKARWCSLNGITLIELPHDESDDSWRVRIDRAREAGHDA